MAKMRGTPGKMPLEITTNKTSLTQLRTSHAMHKYN